MKIVRPWAAQGDYFEILVPEEADWAALAEAVRTAPVDLDAVQRYIEARYSAITVDYPRGYAGYGTGTPDDNPG